MAFDEPEVRVLFPVPLVTVRLRKAEALNARLIEEIAARRTVEPGVGRSNLYGWHSANDLFDRPEPGHAALAAELKAIVEASGVKLMPGRPADLVPSQDGWVNVNPTGAMNAPHDHPGAFWSGVYYVRVPPPADPSDATSGAIEFIDPRGAIGTNARFETPFTRSKFTIRPTAGTCLLWPSYLKHWVHPNQSADDRVTVAFNSWFNRVER
ncbi:MAG: TIGR02466 family protein [Pseudomonadota bacterium]